MNPLIFITQHRIRENKLQFYTLITEDAELCCAANVDMNVFVRLFINVG
jgi:hypothetical protein